MPTYLRDEHYKGAAKLRGAGLKLDAFSQPHQIAKQAYLPQDLIGHHYFVPRNTSNELQLYKHYRALFEYIYQRKFEE